MVKSANPDYHRLWPPFDAKPRYCLRLCLYLRDRHLVHQERTEDREGPIYSFLVLLAVVEEIEAWCRISDKRLGGEDQRATAAC